jgi:hypothetical protein
MRATFRQRPPEYPAVRWTGDNFEEVVDFLRDVAPRFVAGCSLRADGTVRVTGPNDAPVVLKADREEWLVYLGDTGRLYAAPDWNLERQFERTDSQIWLGDIGPPPAGVLGAGRGAVVGSGR